MRLLPTLLLAAVLAAAHPGATAVGEGALAVSESRR